MNTACCLGLYHIMILRYKTNPPSSDPIPASSVRSYQLPYQLPMEANTDQIDQGPFECIICLQFGATNGIEPDTPKPICDMMSVDIETSSPKEDIVNPVLGNLLGRNGVRNGVRNPIDAPRTCRIHHRCNGHAHPICIGKWLDRNPRCPMCRSVVTASSASNLSISSSPVTDSSVTGSSDQNQMRLTELDIRRRSMILTEDLVSTFLMISLAMLCCLLLVVVWVTILYAMINGK